MKEKIQKLRNMICEKKTQMDALEDELEQLKITAIGNKYNEHIVFGSWDCPNSPTGECVYDAKQDPCLDGCIYCGEPDERK